jgi:hypothetical protein
MVLCTLEDWERALMFLEHAICLPAPKPSAIVLEAFKKYVLVSLILGRNNPEKNLPGYRSPSIQRVVARIAQPWAIFLFLH